MHQLLTSNILHASGNLQAHIHQLPTNSDLHAETGIKAQTNKAHSLGILCLFMGCMQTTCVEDLRSLKEVELRGLGWNYSNLQHHKQGILSLLLRHAI